MFIVTLLNNISTNESLITLAMACLLVKISKDK